jgi:inhibitor of cysteine peptidase
MTRHFTAAFALIALAACAPQEGAEPEGESQSFKSIAAPTQAGVVQHITEADDGKTVVVKSGTKIQVELVGTPTAGYVWALKTAPAFLVKTGEGGGPTSEAQSQPGFAGGNHWEVFFFDVTGKGEGALVIEQRRPWEDTGPADDTFTVNVKAE